MNSPGKGQTTQLRITKARPGSSKTAFSFLRSSIQDTGVGPVDIIFTPRAEGNHLALGHVFAGEQRLSLECPHCKVKSTIIRQRSQPKCAKCSRTFQGDWQFCPIDGSKRPADPNEWKFCPACGKKVEIEKAAVQEGGVPLLSDLPIVGDLFRSPNTPTPPRAFTPGGVEPMILPAVPGAAPRFLKRPAAPAPVPGIPAIPTPTEPVAPAPAPEPPVRAR